MFIFCNSVQSLINDIYLINIADAMAWRCFANRCVKFGNVPIFHACFLFFLFPFFGQKKISKDGNINFLSKQINYSEIETFVALHCIVRYPVPKSVLIISDIYFLYVQKKKEKTHVHHTFLNFLKMSNFLHQFWNCVWP